MSLLQIDKLSLEIGGVQILRDVSLRLDAGQILGVIGESGSGKSMTAFAVTQLLPVGATCRGRVLLQGQDVLAQTEAQMCQLRGRVV